MENEHQIRPPDPSDDERVLADAPIAPNTSETASSSEFPYSSDLPLSVIVTDEDFSSRTTPTVPPPPPSMLIAKEDGDPDVTNPSIRSELLAEKERRAAGVMSKKKMVLGAAVVLSMSVFVILAIRQLTIDSETTSPPSPPESTVSSAQSNVVPAGETAPSMTDDDTILIRFDTLPQNASVKFNQQPVAAPIVAKRSQTAQFVEVIVGDERVFSTTIIPDRNRTIVVPKGVEKLSREHRRKKRKEKTKTADSPQTTHKNAGKLSSNPFPLKTNPFLTGE